MPEHTGAGEILEERAQSGKCPICDEFLGLKTRVIECKGKEVRVCFRHPYPDNKEK